MGIKSPNSHIGSYGYQKSKIITSSKTSKSKSVFEVKPNNPCFEYFSSYFHGESKIKMCNLYQIFLIKKKIDPMDLSTFKLLCIHQLKILLQKWEGRLSPCVSG